MPGPVSDSYDPEFGTAAKRARANWQNEVIMDGGLICPNCKQWRLLADREIEACEECKDEAFDIYLVSEYELP